MKPKYITITNEFAARVVEMLSHYELTSGELDAGIAACELRGLIALDYEAPEPPWSPKADFELNPEIDPEAELDAHEEAAADDEYWQAYGDPDHRHKLDSVASTRIARELILD